MTYHKLTEGSFVVRGASRGALLDTNSQNVYSINMEGVAVLAGETRDDNFWHELSIMKLAEECSQSVKLPDLPRMQKPQLNFIWFEIEGEDCNESCLHCYADSMPPTYRRANGLPELSAQNSKRKLSFEEWCALIKDGHELGCQACQFIGGEPFLYRDNNRTVLDLAVYAKKIGYTWIEIFTNATLITQKKVQKIKDLGLNIAVSLYSNNPEIHDSITQTPGSHAKTVASLQMLKEAGVPTRVAIVAMKRNENTILDTLQFINDLGFDEGRPDPLRPKGRGQNIGLMPSPVTTIKYGVMTKPDFKASQQVITHYTTGHSCLAGKITITETGDVLPCIFSRDQIMGNVLEAGGLETVTVGAALQQVWNTTKDSVMVCKDCEYRYVCFDCRPLSEAAALGNAEYLHAPYPRCSYNPYTGEWAKGLWRMTKAGLIYDRQYGANIHQVLAGTRVNRDTSVGDRITESGKPEITLVTGGGCVYDSDQSDLYHSGCQPTRCQPECNPMCYPANCQPECRPMCYPANCSPQCTPACSPYCLPQCTPR
jgi:MoaA/NifB/PqqE/SkfB family radical SAM enzyme